jgi:hypothetical protein
MSVKSSSVKISAEAYGPKTGVALLYPAADSTSNTTVSGSKTRPILVISSGRHEVSMCYAVFPDDGDTGYSKDGLPIVAGQFSNVSVCGDLILFAGDSSVEKNTPSQIFQLDILTRTCSLLWTDEEMTHFIRNGCFVRNCKDIVLVGASRNQNGEQQAEAAYYTYSRNKKKQTIEWKLTWKHTESNSNFPYTVGVSALATPSKAVVIALGNPISCSKFNEEKSNNQSIQSCLLAPQSSTNHYRVNTNMQTIACYIGPILSKAPNESGSGSSEGKTDAIFIGGGQIGQIAQSFLVTDLSLSEVSRCEHDDGGLSETALPMTAKTRMINLGPPMDGRSVAVYDFTGNGLLDIFIVCVQSPHLLMLQKGLRGCEQQEGGSNYPFVAFTVKNEIGGTNKEGEARGVVAGRLYGNADTVEVAITDAASNHGSKSKNVVCRILSFKVHDLQARISESEVTSSVVNDEKEEEIEKQNCRIT